MKLDYYHLDDACDLALKRSEVYRGDVLVPVVPLPKNTVALLKLAGNLDRL
mgnify:FL=1